MHLNIVHPRVEQLLRNIVGSPLSISLDIILFCRWSLVEGDGCSNDYIQVGINNHICGNRAHPRKESGTIPARIARAAAIVDDAEKHLGEVCG